MSKLLRLNNGLLMPNHAFGTSNLPLAPSEFKPILSGALQAGFKHIDTAGSYGVEPAIGQSLRDLGTKREDIWITSKVWPVWYRRIKERFHTTLSDL
jgi:D-arabinose 1-dehydrogenase